MYKQDELVSGFFLSQFNATFLIAGYLFSATTLFSFFEFPAIWEIRNEFLYKLYSWWPKIINYLCSLWRFHYLKFTKTSKVVSKSTDIRCTLPTEIIPGFTYKLKYILSLLVDCITLTHVVVFLLYTVSKFSYIFPDYL